MNIREERDMGLMTDYEELRDAYLTGDVWNIDKKRNQYYGHSNTDCPLDLKKSAYLEPTEEDAQLQPRSPNCKLTRWQEKYKHQRSLDCMAKLDF